MSNKGVYLLYSKYNHESEEVKGFISHHSLWDFVDPVCCDSQTAHELISSRSIEIPCLVIQHGGQPQFKFGQELRQILMQIMQSQQARFMASQQQIPAQEIKENMNSQVSQVTKNTTPQEETPLSFSVTDSADKNESFSAKKDARGQVTDMVKQMAAKQQAAADELEDQLRAQRGY
jgi:hypothetical protein